MGLYLTNFDDISFEDDGEDILSSDFYIQGSEKCFMSFYESVFKILIPESKFTITSSIENARRAKIQWFSIDDFSEIRVTLISNSGREQDTGLVARDWMIYDPDTNILNAFSCRIKFYYSEDRNNLTLIECAE